MRLLLLVGLLSASLHLEAGNEYGKRIVAAVLMGEARGEGKVGMTAVAEVISRRASNTGKSPLEVVTTRKRFSCLNGKKPEDLYRQFADMKLFKIAYAIAEQVYDSPNTFKNITKDATHYDGVHSNPYWKSAMVETVSIGRHIFYKAR